LVVLESSVVQQAGLVLALEQAGSVLVLELVDSELEQVDSELEQVDSALEQAGLELEQAGLELELAGLVLVLEQAGSVLVLLPGQERMKILPKFRKPGLKGRRLCRFSVLPCQIPIWRKSSSPDC
jgi:hypothetical protein